MTDTNFLAQNPNNDLLYIAIWMVYAHFFDF